MAPSMIAKGRRALLFDIDGTLADTVPSIIAGLGDAYERFAGVRPPDAELAALIGRSLPDQMKLYGLDRSSDSSLVQRMEYAMARFRAHGSMSALFEPAIEAWQTAVSRGWRTALVTSKNRDELQGFLDDFAILRRADAVVCASDVDRPKPSPESALLACRLLGVGPSEAVFIGDSVFDIECAHAAGMPCVAVAYGAATVEQLGACAPDLLLETPERLRDWVQRDLPTATCHERNQPLPTPIWATSSP